MFCQKCGAAIASGHVYCEAHEPVAVSCPSCGWLTNREATYCSTCGRELPVKELKRATVLIADLAGSSKLALDPARQVERASATAGRDAGATVAEQIDSVLSPAVEIMTAAAERYGGDVKLTTGDGIIAVFGEPRALEDHATRACLAAVSLHDGVRRWNEAQHRAGSGLEYHVRVGLSSGEVVTGHDKSSGPYGEATILARRMEELAPPGRTLLTRETWRLVKGAMRTTPLGSREVQGKRDLVEIYQLEGVEAQTRFNARQNQGLTQFVGREAELDALAGGLRCAASGDGQVVVVVGGAGVGKSRLVHQFLHLGSGQATTLEASAEPFDRDSVYLPIANLLRSELGVVPSDPPSVIRDRLEARLGERRELLQAASALLDLPGPEQSSDEWTELDAVQKRHRISAAVRHLILDKARDSTLVLVIEDLQWLGDDTRALVDDLIDQTRNRAVLLVLTSREHTTPRGPHCQVVELPALERLRAQAMLSHLIGDDAAMQPFRALVLGRADDKPTPLFLEETVRSLIEQGVLQGESGHYQLHGNLETIAQHIPDKVEEVLAARIDWLGSQEARKRRFGNEDDKRPRANPKVVLEAASVIGMEAPLELLSAVTKYDVAQLLGALSELGASDLMYESLSSGQPEFSFKHTLTREVAASRIPTIRRREMHGQIVEAIESLYAHRREEWIERLADHAFKAGLWEKAYSNGAEACRRAIDRSAHRYAVKFFARSLEALTHLPDTPERREREIDLRLMALNALLPIGEQAQVSEHLRAAKELAVGIGDDHRLAKVELQRAFFLWETGSHHAANEAGRRALAVATQYGLVKIGLAARLHIGIVHHARGEFRDALDLHRRVLDDLRAAGLEKRRSTWAAYPGVITRAFCADCHISLGDFAEADSLIREGTALTKEIGHPYSRTLIEAVTGRYYLARDEPAIATFILEQAERRCREDEVDTMLPAVVSALGTALARSGRTAQALEMLQDALGRQIYLRAGNYTFFYLLMATGETHLIAGHPDEALDMAGQAERLTRRNEERAHLAQALHLLGAIHARRDDLSAAETAYGEALAGADRAGMRPLAADCWLGLAGIDRRLGRSGAGEKFAAAKSQLLALGLRRRAQQVGLIV